MACRCNSPGKTPAFLFDIFDYRFDYQTMYQNVPFCMFLYLPEGIRKTPARYVVQGFSCVAQIGLEPMTLRV